MSVDIKENVKNSEVWLRGLFIILFGAILYFAVVLVWLLVVFQFVSKLLTGNVNPQLAGFGAGLVRYISQVPGIYYVPVGRTAVPFQSLARRGKSSDHQTGNQAPHYPFTCQEKSTGITR